MKQLELLKLPKKVQKFIYFVKNECEKYDVEFILSNVNQVKLSTGQKCSGLFNIKSLVVATKNRELKYWLANLVHEFCHFQQWKNRTRVFRKANNEFYEWLSNKRELVTEHLKESYKRTRNVELDCERRAIRMIKRYKLPIPINQYIRMANCYIYTHKIMRDIRKWYKGPKREMPEIGRLVSSKKLFHAKEYDTPPKKFYKLMVEYCF